MTKRHAVAGLAAALVWALLPGPVAWAQATAKPASAAASYRDAKWEELVPKGWDPTKKFRAMNLGMLGDDHPKVQEMMREMRETWDNAPTVKELDGAAVRLPGYVVPLEEVKGELKEFLLVPYYGACIHSPPPPANQIVHVVAAKPVKGIRSMDTVWVSGTLKSARKDSGMGMSGYQMAAAVVVPYEANR